MRIIESLEAGNIYHLYNCGINGTDIFNEKRNYYHFLDRYEKYCTDILETYAYALLKNHFHLMAKIKEGLIVTRRDGKGEMELNASRQLSHFFNSYAQSYNNAYSRHGKLFEEPFRRKLIDNDDSFTSLISYIHFNPQNHQFVKDFRDWEFTSWHPILNDKNTFLMKEKVIEWFGSKQLFIDAHINNISLSNISNLIIE
jgi:putative transposase